MTSVLLINFKTYPRATGEKARELAQACEEVAGETDKRIIAAPSLPDTFLLEESDIPVYSQHIDPVKPGSHTGHVTAENLRETGVEGTLINHSERRMAREKIEKAIQRAEKHGLETVVCAQDPEECAKYSSLGPDFIAYEPPELIGGDTSVAEAKPEVIEKAVDRSETRVLTGAGINDREDVEKSLELGCEGVLVASAVVKSENRSQKIRELCRGL